MDGMKILRMVLMTRITLYVSANRINLFEKELKSLIRGKLFKLNLYFAPILRKMVLFLKVLNFI